MPEKLTVSPQENHRRLVTLLTAAYAEKNDAQEAVNQAIRVLRAVERKCQNLGEQIANNDKIMLRLKDTGGAND